VSLCLEASRDVSRLVFQSLGLSLGLLVGFFGHKIGVGKWRQRFVGRHKALFTNLCCVLNDWMMTTDPWSLLLDHHVYGCTSLCYVSNDFFNHQLCSCAFVFWSSNSKSKLLVLNIWVLTTNVHLSNWWFGLPDLAWCLLSSLAVLRFIYLFMFVYSGIICAYIIISW